MRFVRKKIILWAIAVCALALVYLFHENRRPFISTDDFSVSATNDGQPLDTNVFKVAFLEDRFYLQFDNPLSEHEYHDWIAFSHLKKRANLPIGLYQSIFGYRYTHADQAIGINLESVKLEGLWSVEREGEDLVLKSKSLTITISRNNK